MQKSSCYCSPKSQCEDNFTLSYEPPFPYIPNPQYPGLVVINATCGKNLKREHSDLDWPASSKPDGDLIRHLIHQAELPGYCFSFPFFFAFLAAFFIFFHPISKGIGLSQTQSISFPHSSYQNAHFLPTYK